MISAAVKGLARLSYGYSEIIQCASIHIPLATEEIREITEANFCLLKVLVAKSQADGLQMRLKSMVEGLLKWQDSTKSHFTAK
ncbi:hypothetical protein RJ641_015545, partial [Dillenia turbinata]